MMKVKGGRHRRRNGDVLPAAPLQTKHGRVSGLPSALSSPPSQPLPSLPLHNFFFVPPPPFSGESGRRKQGVAELQNFGNLSHPSLEASTTAPLVGDWAGVCLSLSAATFTTQDTLLLLISISATLLRSLPPGGAAAEAAGGI